MLEKVRDEKKKKEKRKKRRQKPSGGYFMPKHTFFLSSFWWVNKIEFQPPKRQEEESVFWKYAAARNGPPLKTQPKEENEKVRVFFGWVFSGGFLFCSFPILFFSSFPTYHGLFVASFISPEKARDRLGRKGRKTR